MKAYTPNTSKGRTVGGHDIHHKTADQPKAAANAAAKAMRHAARQQGKQQAIA
jgi:hypothetical protein